MFSNKKETQIFLMQYDIVRLGVKIEDEIYVTEYMLCLSSNVDDYNCVKDMIQTLLDFNDEIISRWIFGMKNRNQLRFAFLNGALVTEAYKSIESFHQIINEIIVCYQRNASIFRNRCTSKFIYVQDKISYQDIRRFGKNEFSWLTKNMEVLKEINADSTIRYGMRKYLPEYIKCDSSRKTTDTYENRVVVAFLAHVIKKVNVIMDYFSSMIDEERDVFNKLKTFETNERKAPILVVKEYQIKNAEMTLAKLVTDVEMLKRMYINYTQIIPCEPAEIITMPRKTKIFQEIQHYSEIYQYIVKWYKYGEMSLKKENLLFKIKTIDKIYEYFCLFKLLILFKQNGFNIVGDGDTAEFYEYLNLIPDTKDVLDVANTYKLTDGVSRVTLYYEPVIYSNNEDTTNEINLYRLDGSSYYTPDFLLKYERDGKEKYAILDSKYSKRKSITKYNVLENLLVKYCISIASKKSLYPAVIFMWLLQGRNDNAEICYFHNSGLANKYKANVSYGIYTLNRIDDCMKEIWDELVRVTS